MSNYMTKRETFFYLQYSDDLFIIKTRLILGFKKVTDVS